MFDIFCHKYECKINVKKKKNPEFIHEINLKCKNTDIFNIILVLLKQT